MHARTHAHMHTHMHTHMHAHTGAEQHHTVISLIFGLLKASTIEATTKVEIEAALKKDSQSVSCDALDKILQEMADKNWVQLDEHGGVHQGP